MFTPGHMHGFAFVGLVDRYMLAEAFDDTRFFLESWMDHFTPFHELAIVAQGNRVDTVV